MGGTASKAARKLPKRAEAPTWAGVRTSEPGKPQAKPQGRASETKTEAIERDAQDPHFLANLNQLGPVRVDHHMQTIKPAQAETARLFKSRAQSEFEASAVQTPRNRLHAMTLSELLDERKAVTKRGDLQRLSDQYGIDVSKIENLARFVSSPSVKGGTAVRTVGHDGEERLTMTAVWIEPRLQDPKTLTDS